MVSHGFVGTLFTLLFAALTHAAANPFGRAALYSDSQYINNINRSIMNVNNGDPLRMQLDRAKRLNPAIWATSLAALGNYEGQLGFHLDQIQRQSSTLPDDRSLVVTLVVYNTPMRDCSAGASAGEMPGNGYGVQRYKAEFIDKIVSMLSRFRENPKVKFAFVLEPDVIANYVSNGQCRGTFEGPAKYSNIIYIEALSYAVERLSTVARSHIYVDVGHNGWTGSGPNFDGTIQFLDKLTKIQNNRIRGFASNVSNFRATEDEEAYLRRIIARFPGKAGLIDTSRNGAYVAPEVWCNPRSMGMGPRFKVNPAAGIDAYMYIKRPGESDGASWDWGCSGSANLSNAPAAGQWFHEGLLQLIRGANPTF